MAKPNQIEMPTGDTVAILYEDRTNASDPRVHLAEARNPIVGDELYGSAGKKAGKNLAYALWL